MLRENSELTMKSDILIESVNFCLFKCIFLFICINFSYGNHLNNTTTRNEFVNQCRRDCIIKRDAVGCGKYRVVKWLHEVVLEKELSYGPFRVIKIPATTQNPIFPEIPKTRDLKFQFSETLNFFRNIGDDFIRRRAVVYTLIPSSKNFRSFESGPVIVDEDELARIQKEDADDSGWRLFHKKKKSVILPVLILLNLLKLKLLIIPILFGVHLIKKLIIIGGLFVPGILSRFKICKVPPHHHHPYHAWATGHGYDDVGWSHRNDLLPGPGYSYPQNYQLQSPYSPYYRQRR